MDLKAEIVTDAADFFKPLFFEEEIPVFLVPDPDVIGGGEVFHQLEVLVHHADTEVFGILRRIDGDLFSVDINFAAVRFIDPGEHIHQCCFSGTVFPQ